MRSKPDETQMRGIRREQDYRALKRSIFLIGFILPVLPLVVVGGVLFAQVHGLLARRAQAHVADTVHSAGQMMDAWFERQQRVIGGLLKVVVDESQPGPPALGRLRPMIDILDVSYSAWQLVDSRNAILDRIGTWPEAARHRATGKEVAEMGDRTHLQVVEIDPGMSGLILETSQVWNGTPVTLRGWIDSAAIAGALVPASLERSAAVAILIQDHVVFAQNRFSETASRDEGVPWDQTLFVPREDGQRLARKVNISGRGYYVASAPIGNGTGFLGIQQPVADALADFRKARRIFAALVLAVSLGIGLYAFSLSRQMVHRIQQADARKQQMIEKMFQTGKLASIGELAAGIAHEINNPVAIMVEEAGWVGDLLAEEEFSQGRNLREMSRALNQIRSQGRRCKEITQKLLSFARETDFTTRRTHVAELVADTLAMAGEKAKQQGVTLVRDIQPNLPPLFLPDTEFQQVLLNLVNNGLDAIQEVQGQLTISVSLKDERLILQVRDTGTGIAPEHLPRIFDPFFTTKPVGKGTGLGLSICYGLVDKMGGTIRVDSQIDRGSTFTVVVPVQNAQIETTDPSDRTTAAKRQDGSHG